MNSSTYPYTSATEQRGYSIHALYSAGEALLLRYGICEVKGQEFSPPPEWAQYCSARDLKAILNFFLFIDLQKGTGDASIVRLRYHRKHLWIVTCYYKIS